MGLGRSTEYWYLIRSFIYLFIFILLFKILMANVFVISDTTDFQCLAIVFYYGCRLQTLIENRAFSRLLLWIEHKALSSSVFCDVAVIFTLYTTFILFSSQGQIKRKTVLFLKIKLTVSSKISAASKARRVSFVYDLETDL